METDFRPPRTSRVAVACAYLVFPLLPRLARRIVAIESPPEEWDRLHALRDRRFVCEQCLWLFRHRPLTHPAAVFEPVAPADGSLTLDMRMS